MTASTEELQILFDRFATVATSLKVVEVEILRTAAEVAFRSSFCFDFLFQFSPIFVVLSIAKPDDGWL